MEARQDQLAVAEWWIRAITTKQDPWIARFVQRAEVVKGLLSR